MKKRVSERIKKIISPILLFSSLFFSSCGINWFSDVKEDIEKKITTNFRFYSQKEEETKEPVIENYSAVIGSEFSPSQVLKDRFPEVIQGYYIDGWKYYRNPGNQNATEIPDNLIPSEDQKIQTVKVTPESLDFYASWSPKTDTKYTVKHYFQTVDLQNYEIDETKTQILTGTTDTKTKGTALSIKGFTASLFDQININGDGSSVLKILYNRQRRIVTVYYNDNRPEDGVQFEGYYGQTIADLQIPDRISDKLRFEKWIVTNSDGSTNELTSTNIVFDENNAVYSLVWTTIPSETKVSVIYPEAEDDVDLDYSLTVTETAEGSGLYNISCTGVPSDYREYSWIIDGVMSGNHNQTLDIQSYAMKPGNHSIILVVTDSDGNQFSRETIVQIKGF